jgi:hypothetical protein
MQRGEEGADMAVQLMQAAGIPLNRPMYGVRDAKRIQQLFDVRFGAQQVRLVLLERERAFQVAWKGPQTALFTLVVVCVQQHWSYIQHPHQLFDVSFAKNWYCI